eukprot:3803679-Rhodomonas_salina.2
MSTDVSTHMSTDYELTDMFQPTAVIRLPLPRPFNVCQTLDSHPIPSSLLPTLELSSSPTSDKKRKMTKTILKTWLRFDLAELSELVEVLLAALLEQPQPRV